MDKKKALLWWANLSQELTDKYTYQLTGDMFTESTIPQIVKLWETHNEENPEVHLHLISEYIDSLPDVLETVDDTYSAMQIENLMKFFKRMKDPEFALKVSEYLRKH